MRKRADPVILGRRGLSDIFNILNPFSTWTVHIVITGPMVEWLHTHTHWILEAKQQQKPKQQLAKSLVYDNIT